MHFLYNTAIRIFALALPFLSLLNKKWNKFYRGRKNQRAPRFKTSPVWVHCASLGEFEQGRPVIEAIKKEFPGIPLVLTFFSPSGYEIRKDYPFADWVAYLPLDTPSKAAGFVDHIRPRLAIFVKYEYWFNHLLALEKADVPFVFIANVWRRHYFPLKPWAAWFLQVIRKGSCFFAQDQLTMDLLSEKGFERVVQAGDTRIDRVLQLVENKKILPEVEKWKGSKTTLIAGSTWPSDERLIAGFLERHPEITLILAPHEPSPSRIEDIRKGFAEFLPIRYSEWKGEDARVIVVDSMGLLNALYAYGDAAYIGGGFGRGIHNTLEAAVYGIPVFFGPRHQNFKEAIDLIGLGLAFEVNTVNELVQQWEQIVPSELPRIKGQVRDYFDQNRGATAKIIDYLRPLIQH
ncbi:MAG TPA: glycosyltransferase N-terminal domain-containing protein [Saprospiraceae bacterium]|nr:glycosyltransferase N-terminal domain-containing protein [Saprospiraceae bacterium]HNT20380.1 glycosyltransferase N-terminal domain-containing protein [Saprospiraceae bacterium]